MSNSYIIMHETAIYWNGVSLMRTVQKHLRVSGSRVVCFRCLFQRHSCSIYGTADGRVHPVCSVCTEWQSFVVRRSVADDSTLKGGRLESERSKMVHCSSKHKQSQPAMRIDWNFHQTTCCKTSWSFLLTISVPWGVWKHGQFPIYSSAKPMPWSVIEPCIHIIHICLISPLFATSLT